jgi:eukaryotic-like serine/threonine-protein kinase
MTEETIFLGALGIKNPALRARYLGQSCGADTDLRRAVEQLLAAHEEPGLLDRPVLAPTELPVNEHKANAVGNRIGPYVLDQRLGEGGMGEVWVAKQTEPIKRKVALKLIKAGMDSKAIVARFEHERHALALMDHPNIARVLDGGVTSEGRLFFVMELVNGLPLAKYCDEARLTLKQRLELFVPICLAVQHAHQKGIVHRDLKPSNILVTLYDGRPVPKVIDFGVAKALAGKLTDETVTTQFGVAIGTLEYMAPEQAGYSAVDVDTRADVYSLGVILYELLTGLIPIDKKRFRRAEWMEAVRILREEEPLRPSARFSTEESSPSLAALRQTEPRRLTQLLRGELDWVVMRCLEKSRDRRYDSASALARDIQRYLADEPVEARPPSLIYRAGKFFRRNKGTVLTAAIVILLLVGGIIGTTLGMLDAIHHEQIAAKAADDSKKAEARETAAKMEAEEAKKDALAKLWGAHLNEANARRYSGRRGQRFESLKSIQAALKLPVPDGRSIDELRNAAIAALCLPDIGDGPEWDPDVGPAVPEHPAFRSLLQYQKAWARLPNPKFPLRGPSMSRDGRFVVAALEPHLEAKQNTVRVQLWRVDEAEPQAVGLPNPSVFEQASAFSPDSKQLALGHLDGTVSLYDAESGKEIRKLRAGSSGVFCLAYHPTLPRLALGVREGDVDTACILDLDGRVLQRLSHPNIVFSVAWRPDGRQLAVGCEDRLIYLWNAEDGKPATAPWKGHTTDGGIRLSFNPAGDRLLSNDWGGHARLWDTRAGRELFRTPEGPLHYVEPGLIGVRVTGKKLGLLRVAEGHELRQMGAVSVHPDRRLAAAATPSGLAFYNLASAERVAMVPVIAIQGASFDQSGGMWTVNASTAYRWPVRLTDAVNEIGPPEKVADLAPALNSFSCDKSGNVVAIPQFRHGAIVIHRNENNRQVRLEPHYDVRWAFVSPDGKWVSTQSQWVDGSGVKAKVWNASSGKLLKELPKSKTLWQLGFSPDSRWLITSAEWDNVPVTERKENSHRLWEVGTWNEAGTLPTLGIPSWEHDVILEGQRDGTILITQISTRKELARLSSPEAGRIHPEQLLASGFLLAAGDETGRWYVWDLPLIRRQLAEMGLDWNGPPFFDEAKMKFARSPYTVRVNAGELADKAKSKK